MKRVILLALAVTAICVFWTPRTHAQQPLGYGAYSGYGTGYYGTYRSLYGLGRLPVPPYYALHPPVYYSHPVARTYGTNPFVCPCKDYAAIEPTPVEAIENPYFVPKAEATSAPSEQQTARVIINPFYDSGERLVAND
jgi:hypothetical protein